LNSDQLNEAVRALEAKDVSAFGGVVDVSDESSLSNWVSEAAKQLGGIDIMVSNVGAMAIGADKDSWQQNLNVDVLGLVYLVEAGLPQGCGEAKCGEENPRECGFPRNGLF